MRSLGGFHSWSYYTILPVTCREDFMIGLRVLFEFRIFHQQQLFDKMGVLYKILGSSLYKISIFLLEIFSFLKFFNFKELCLAVLFFSFKKKKIIALINIFYFANTKSYWEHKVVSLVCEKEFD